MNPQSAQFSAGWQMLAVLDQQQFDLLERSVELVVQAQAFSMRGLQLALRLRTSTAMQITSMLESLGIVSAGAPDAARYVLVQLNDLAAVLGELRNSRSIAA